MNWKKIAVTICFVMILPTTAFAYGEFWYDVTSHLPQFKKIVIYPVRGVNGKYMMNEDELSEVYQVNDYFDKRFIRKLKIKTISLGSSLKENKEIRADAEKYKSLYYKFPSENKRAATITAVTAANGYIIPRINLDKLEPHKSPEKTVTVEMKSWTEEVIGSVIKRRYGEKKWTEKHTIPAKDLMLYHMGINYNVYDRNGKKIMTYRNFEHTYEDSYTGITNAVVNFFGGKTVKSLKPERYRVEILKHIIDEFRRDFKDLQDNFKTNKKKQRISTKIGFKEINLPDNVGRDEYALKSAYFSMKDLAFKYTNLSIDYDGKGDAKYFVQGNITHYALHRKWIEPYVTLDNKEISSETSDYYDSKGKKHKKEIIKYETKIVDHHGYWEYKAKVSATFNLVDKNGKVIVSHSANQTDDKVADAYRHLLKDFYIKVNKYFNEKQT